MTATDTSCANMCPGGWETIYSNHQSTKLGQAGEFSHLPGKELVGDLARVTELPCHLLVWEGWCVGLDLWHQYFTWVFNNPQSELVPYLLSKSPSWLRIPNQHQPFPDFFSLLRIGKF